MLRTLTVTTAAADLQLLTIGEMRDAAGVADSSQDAKLSALGLRIAADIATECNIAIGAGGAPTLRRETLTEVWRGVYADELLLARRHEVTIASVVEDGTTVDAADYLVDPQTGILTRLSDDLPTGWCAEKVTIVYAAGFDTIPGDLKDAALEIFRSAWLSRSRDPLVKGRETDIPGLMRERTDYWIGTVPGQSNEGAVPDLVEGKLARYRNAALG